MRTPPTSASRLAPLTGNETASARGGPDPAASPDRSASESSHSVLGKRKVSGSQGQPSDKRPRSVSPAGRSPSPSWMAFINFDAAESPAPGSSFDDLALSGETPRLVTVTGAPPCPDVEPALPEPSVARPVLAMPAARFMKTAPSRSAQHWLGIDIAEEDVTSAHLVRFLHDTMEVPIGPAFDLASADAQLAALHASLLGTYRRASKRLKRPPIAYNLLGQELAVRGVPEGIVQRLIGGDTGLIEIAMRSKSERIRWTWTKMVNLLNAGGAKLPQPTDAQSARAIHAEFKRGLIESVSKPSYKPEHAEWGMYLARFGLQRREIGDVIGGSAKLIIKYVNQAMEQAQDEALIPDASSQDRADPNTNPFADPPPTPP